MSEHCCPTAEEKCRNAGTPPLVASLALAEIIAKDKTNPEIAVWASFFSSLAANLGVIIQNRNLCNIKNAAAPEEDIDFSFNDPSALFPPEER